MAPKRGKVANSAAPAPVRTRVQPRRAARDRQAAAPPAPFAVPDPEPPRPRRRAAPAPAAANGASGVKKTGSKKTAGRGSRRRPAAAARAQQEDGVNGEDGAGRPEAPQAPVAEDGEDVEVQTDEFRNMEVLAQEQIDQACRFVGEPATLRVTLKVHRDPNRFHSRLGYRAQINLIRAAGDEDEAGEQVGYIHSWRIDKPTARFPNATREQWRQTYLKRSPNTHDENIRENSWCLQALFSAAGHPRREVEAHDTELRDESLMFIQMVYTFERFRRNGLLRPMLEAYHTLLGRLPEWYAFSGSCVLVPGKPGGVRANGWGETDDAEVENTLIGAYERNGGYTVWVRDCNVKSTAITVMGRRVPDPVEPAVVNGDGVDA